MGKEQYENSVGVAVAWSFAAELSAKMIVPVSNMILARILAPEVFGIIATINMIVSFADMMSTAGFQKYLVQHQYSSAEEQYQSTTVAFWTNLAISLLAWLLIAVNCERFSEMVGNPGYGIPLMVAALSLPLTSFSSIQKALFQRKLNYKVLFVRRLSVALVPLVVTIPLALLGFEHWSLIIGNLSGIILRAVILTVMSDWKPNLFFSFRLLKEMFSFSFWTLMESIALWASSYIDILIISNTLGSYYTGLYKNSQSTVTGILSIITGATTPVLFAALSRFQDDKESFEKLFFEFQRNVALIVLPIGVGIFCFRDLITLILLGKKWMEASMFVGIWGLCTSIVCVFGTFSREVYRAKGKPKISLIAQLIHLSFVVPVCWISVHKGFGVLIYTRSLAYLQIVAVHMVVMKLCFKISPLRMLLSVKEIILSAAVMGGFAQLMMVYFTPSVVIQFAIIACCILLYFGFLYCLPRSRVYLSSTVKLVINRIFSKKLKHKESEIES